MSALELFHPLIRKWFSQRLGPPTEVQERAWPVISNGSHVLVTAPTGSGKTLTAFLWAVHRMLSGQLSTGSIRVLYISPLKALNNDMRQNLLTPLEELRNLAAGENTDLPRISVAVRSGDTPPGRPPEIFITTPESLNILLTSGQGEKLFGNLAVVILDEVHAVVSQKRGTLLITAVERLVPICGEFQRIALSATVRPLEVVARFVGGYRMRGSGKTVVYEERPVSTIRVLQGKQYAISVCAAAEADPAAAVANPTAAEADPAAAEAAEAGGKTTDNTTGNVATGNTAAG
ncbi:MAG: DEAD/DEAH box helicase, partial [Spirochaetia bacterium]